jgi:three-Cys-motif partner protein
VAKKKRLPDQNEQLFEIPAQAIPPKEPKGPKERVWTENKARFIHRYTSYFVKVTKHGTYLDGFAGPQNPEKPESWSANLVVRGQPASESPRLRHFHLFDNDSDKVHMLESLKAARPDLDVNVYEGDFNVEVDRVLKEAVIGPTEATFCLLDQRTFECSWHTVEKLAGFKGPHKIELFYFLANKWLDRALHTKNHSELRRWWGRDDFLQLENMSGTKRALLIADRFKNELGYAFARPFPIFESQTGTRVVFYMIHASDHARAISLMTNAYDNTVPKRRDFEQLALSVGIDPRTLLPDSQ